MRRALMWLNLYGCEAAQKQPKNTFASCTTGGTKLERFLPKNQHTLRKLLNFENWINGGLRSFQKLEF